jgi:hypothetical protein
VFQHNDEHASSIFFLRLVSTHLVFHKRTLR